MAGLAASLSAQTPASGPLRAVALTFDDLPMTPVEGVCDAAIAREVTRQILDALARQDAPAAGFVNASRTCGEPVDALRDPVLEAWLDAGHELGNHTWSHPDLVRTPLETYLVDVRKGAAPVDSLLRRRGSRLVWFRHPFLHAGNTPAKKAGLERYLEDNSWRVAPVTIDNQEWVYAYVYHQALARGDSALAARVVESYLDHVDGAFAHFEARSREVVGREVPQVLLLHANRLNADHLESLLDRIRARGYVFRRLEQVMKDPAYAREDRYLGRRGPSWIERWAARGGEAPQGPREHPWVAETYERLRSGR